MHAEYKIAYLGREDLSDEELALEGFTRDDDFNWSGKIDASWKSIVLSLMDVQSPDHEQLTDFSQTELKIVTQEHNSETEMIFYDFEELEYKIQEVVQALFETSGREAPLKLFFRDVASKQKDNYEVTVAFANRTCLINKNGQSHKQLKWKEGKYLMSLIYQPDYLLDTVKPKKPGFYLSFDQDNWYSTTDIEESEKLTGFGQEIQKYL